MRRFFKTASICTTLVVSLCSFAGADTGINTAFNEELRPVEVLEAVGTVEMELQFDAPPRHLRVCDSIRVTISINGSLGYDGPESYSVELTDDLKYRGSFEITIPPANEATPSVSSLKVRIGCGDIAASLYATFMVLGEKVKYIPAPTTQRPEFYFPELKPPPPPSKYDEYWAQYGLTEKMVETKKGLTNEHLQTKHTVAIDLRDPDHRKLAESLLGPIPDSAEIPGIKGGFILDITLEQIYMLSEHGVELKLEPIFRKRLLKRNDRNAEFKMTVQPPQGATVTLGDATNTDPMDFYPWASWMAELAGEGTRTASERDLLRTRIRTAVGAVIQELAEDALLPVLIDVREPDTEALVHRLVSESSVSTIAGYREANITRVTAQALLDAGVLFFPNRHASRLQGQTPKPSEQTHDTSMEDGETDPAPSDVMARSVIWEEGFEGDFASGWVIDDINMAVS